MLNALEWVSRYVVNSWPAETLGIVIILIFSGMLYSDKPSKLEAAAAGLLGTTGLGATFFMGFHELHEWAMPAYGLVLAVWTAVVGLVTGVMVSRAFFLFVGIGLFTAGYPLLRASADPNPWLIVDSLVLSFFGIAAWIFSYLAYQRKQRTGSASTSTTS